jgi:pantetheine-phosphate adenylyltransferase
MPASLAVFPGTFDPLTNGHADLIRRASRIFDRLIVAVAANTNKNPLFTVDERVELIRHVLKDLAPRVEVQSFKGLLVEFARSVNTKVMIRGLRAISDYDYEAQMALVNRNLCGDIETFFLTTREEYSYISSTIVKQVALLGGNVEPMVPPAVFSALLAKIKARNENSPRPA